MLPRPAWLRRIVDTLETIAPLKLAGSWDNVGLLVDTVADAAPSPLVVFLTNDLTDRVVTEAISRRASVIVSYHPTPFSGLKRVVREDRASRVVLRSISSGIAIYSPHTALDAVLGGVNDWLAAGVLGLPFTGPTTAADAAFRAAVKPITPFKDPLTYPGAGDGRIVTLPEPMLLTDVVKRVKAFLGLPYVQLSVADKIADPTTICEGSAAVLEAASTSDKALVQTIAVCAGSGISVLRTAKADVWLTGEMSHHDCIAAAAEGTSVIATNHSNTERGYLRLLAERLAGELGSTVEGIPVEIAVSTTDADPLVVV